MAFCKNCGTNIPEGDAFCPNCGESVNGVKAAPVVAAIDGADCQRNKYLAALCYFSFLFGIIGLLAEPDSKFIRYHLNQSLVLTVAAVLCGLVCIIPILGWIVGTVGSILILVFTVMGIVRACKGEATELPIVGKYTILHWD